MEHPWVMNRLCWEYACFMHGIYIYIYIYYLHNSPMRSQRIMNGICMDYAWIMYGLEYAWEIDGLRMDYAWIVICMDYVRICTGSYL